MTHKDFLYLKILCYFVAHLSVYPVTVLFLAIVDALSDPKKFLSIAEKRADQMRALGIETVCSLLIHTLYLTTFIDAAVCALRSPKPVCRSKSCCLDAE